MCVCQCYDASCRVDDVLSYIIVRLDRHYLSCSVTVVMFFGQRRYRNDLPFAPSDHQAVRGSTATDNIMSCFCGWCCVYSMSA